MYFENREIESVTEAPTGWVGLTYKEGSEIRTEVMSKEEYEAGVSESPNPDRQSVWVKSSKGTQDAIIDALKAQNVRWSEAEGLLDWVKEAMRQGHNKLLNLVYGLKDWWNELSVDMLGDAPELKEESTDSLAVYLVLKERCVKFKDVPKVVQGAVSMVNRKQVENLEREIGKPISLWRLDDIEQYSELKEMQYADSQEDPEGVQGDPGREAGELGADTEGGNGQSPEASA